MARTTIATVGFLDRLGDRVIVADKSGGDLEVLRLRPELTADPAFETCLRARGEQLSALQHRNLARVRGVSRLPAPDGRLAVVSEAAKGWRLSEVLQAAEQEGRLIHTSAVLFLLRQVASAAAALHALGPDVSHGALGPERIVVAPGGRAFVLEYVLGSALSHLSPLPADRLWKDLRLAVPADADDDRFGPRTDVLQLGLVALSLAHNRQLRRDEYPGRLAELVEAATESRLIGDRQPIGANLRTWLSRTLQLTPGLPPWSMSEAQQGLEWLVSPEGGYLSTPVGLEPLLQSVADFFNLAPAGDTPASPPTSIVRAARAAATPAPAARPAPASRAESPAQPAPAPLPPPPVVPPASAAEAVESSPVPGVLAASLTPAPVASDVTPSDGMDKAADPGLIEKIGTGRVPTADELLVKPSPLAEFAAERASDAPLEPEVRSALPAPPADLPWPEPPLRPEAPSPSRMPADVAPVADMLSFDHGTTKRRPGRRTEPWVPGPEDRRPTVHRAPVEAPTGGKVTRSGPVPVAATKPVEPLGSPSAAPAPLAKTDAPTPTPAQPPAARSGDVRDVRPPSGSAERAAAHHRAADSSPMTPAHSHVGAPDKSASVRAASERPHPAEPAPASAPVRTARQSGASSVPTRSLFGATDETAHEDAQEEESGSSSGSMTKWIVAAAAVLVLALGGFTAWKYFKSPTIPPAPADAAAPATAAPRSDAPAPAATKDTPAQPAATPGPATAAPAPAAAEAAASGSLHLLSAVKVAVSENGQALGTSDGAITLPAGRHLLEITNEELGVRVTRSVDVRPGRPTRVEVPLPRGSININATPWAEVSIDGQRVGETPLANVQLTVGSHEVRFKHPQLGEQVRNVVVVAGSSGRLSVDMK